ncbi:hypothetical protein D1970_05105 [Mesobacillus zeae]|uniref:Uncharacterized protein n=2 Tax=Mesobacillus zeae TaxID=1917180 RepID=A0A398BIM4_9BACI|nr:hypothetical protein D1970_05105 [Mesobacillus zeae]
MDGTIFYWLAWLAWIGTTFIMRKSHPERLKLSAVLLLLVILSDKAVSIYGTEITLSAIVIALTVMAVTFGTGFLQLLKITISAFVVMLGYVSFLLIELYDPVWVLFDRVWMLAGCGFYLSVLLEKGLKERLAIIFAGFLTGDFLYAFILGNYSFPYKVSSLAFLDVAALAAGMVVTWVGFSNIALAVGQQILHGKGDKGLHE